MHNGNFEDANSLLAAMPRKTSKVIGEDPWNIDTIYALGFCRTLTKVLGIWPPRCRDIFSKIRFFIVIILEISMAINLIREIVANCVAVDEVVNFVALIACAIIATLKVTILRINRAKMKMIVNTAVDDWSTIEDDKSIEIMKKHTKTGRNVFILQTCWCLATIVSLSLPSLLSLISHIPDGNFANTTTINFPDYLNSSDLSSREITSDFPQRSLPMGTGCFLSNNSSLFYALVYILQTIQLVTTCAGNIGTDVYFFSLAMHVCGQFELLKMKFQHFGGNNELIECKREIRVLVKRHNHLIRLCNNFEDTFNVVILAQLTANALHMSLLGIQIIISLKSGNAVVVCGALIAFCVLSLQLLLYSYAGDYLMTQMEKIRDAIYNGQWYVLSSRVIKDLIFVMSRSDRTFNLTAGKVYSMNLDNFKNIIKAMGSYFSVLKMIFDA